MKKKKISGKLSKALSKIISQIFGSVYASRCVSSYSRFFPFHSVLSHLLPKVSFKYDENDDDDDDEKKKTISVSGGGVFLSYTQVVAEDLIVNGVKELYVNDAISFMSRRKKKCV